MADRYEERAREIVETWATDIPSRRHGYDTLIGGIASALREQDAWWPIDDKEHPAPRDGTHILAVLHRAAINDMDGVRRPAFSEVREIWYLPFTTLGMHLPWHAGDPFDSHDGMAPDHFGEDVPTYWRPLLAPPPDTGSAQIPSHETGGT